MNIEEKIFKKYTPNFKKIHDFGFKKQGNKYIFEKSFLNNQFNAIIELDKSITGKVIDIENNDEFLPLRIENQEGTFVGEVRTAYEQILIEIRDNCFVENYFVGPQSNRIAKEIEKKFGDKPLFMWEKFPTLGVFKNPKNDKWYGIVMNIEFSKLDKKIKGNVDVINLKLDKDEIQDLLKKDGFYPAWHMNKKYWITILLNETLSDTELMNFVEKSHYNCK